jgi:hypothetical protein
MAHTLDANTIGLWRLRERSREARLLLDVTAGARHLSFDTFDALIPEVRRARNNIGRCRYFTASQPLAGAYGPGDSALRTLLTGSWSLEAWVNMDSLASGGYRTIFACAGGVGAANNCLGALFITPTTGHLLYYHRHGTTTEETYEGPSAGVTAGTWAHVAMTKTVSGGNAVVRLYINGSLTNTSGSIPNTDGGSTSFLMIGGDGDLFTTTQPFAGYLKDVRLSTGVRTGGEIADSASRTDQLHDVDASTFALWRCAETPDAVDASAYAMDLMMSSAQIPSSPGAYTFEMQSIMELSADSCCGRKFNGSSALVAYDGHPSKTTYQNALAASWTFEAWVKIDPSLVLNARTGCGLFLYGVNGLAPVDNTLNCAGFFITNDRKLQGGVEYGIALNSIWTTTAAAFTEEALRTVHHLAMTKRSIGGGQCKFEFYVDGVFLEESGALTDMEMVPGNKSYMRLGWGDTGSDTGFNHSLFRGTMYEARLSNTRRSASEIAASFAAGVPCLVCTNQISSVRFTPLGVTGAALPPSDDLIARDIWYSLKGERGPEYVVTAHGDWKTVEGEEALRQSLIRAFITIPGEWQTNPGYGAGARAFLKAKNTKTNRDALAIRLRAQALRDDRVLKVDEVKVERVGDGGVRFTVMIVPKGRPERSIPVSVSVVAA